MAFTTLISAEELKALSDAGSVLIVDCSFDLANPGAGAAAYRESHIPGAHDLHLDEELSAPAGLRGRHPLPDPETFAAVLRRIGLNDGQQVVAYDTAGGAFAARLWWLLRWLGHDAVALLDGGKEGWTAADFPLEQDVADNTPGNFVGRGPDHSLTVDAAAVVANLATPSFVVVDARTPERFAGQPNPLDPVPGHIPGARNRFIKDNLGPNGYFKSAADLAEDFQAVLDGVPANQVVLQCGSGVTACHNAIALAIAGLPGARLYPGSWSEWIQDSERPVERDPA